MSRISEVLINTNEVDAGLVKKALAMRIVGNAHSDRPLMDMLHDIIMSDDLPDEDRIAAVKKLDQVVGAEEQPKYSMADVEDYVEQNV
jgi:hypothetical protein